MAVRLLPNDDETCGWIRALPERPPPRRLDGDMDVDWAILGAGFTGLAAARRLAELLPGARIVVVDAQRAGEGASGRNSGFVVDVSTSRAGTDPGADEEYRRKHQLNMAGIAALRERVEAHRIDCQWGEVGKYHCAADEANIPEVEAIASFCQRLGFEHEDLDRAALTRRLGTGYYLRGVFTPHAVMVQPAALVRGLALNLPDTVTLCEETPVTAIGYGATIRLTTATGTIRAANLILAANAFLPAVGVLRRRLMPMTLTASLTRPLSDEEHASIGSPGEWGVLAAHGKGATVRLTRDRRILMRNTAEFWPAMAMSAADLAPRRAIHERAIRVRFPGLGAVEIEHTWSGVTGMSRNLTPFFGRLGANVYASGGYNGSGLARGTIAGRLLVDYALGHDSDLLRHILSFPGPAWIPPRPFLDLAVHWRLNRAGVGLGRDL